MDISDFLDYQIYEQKAGGGRKSKEIPEIFNKLKSKPQSSSGRSISKLDKSILYYK